MTRLLIVRHGNTFGPNDTPTRLGGGTDLPLVESGLEQGAALGRYLKKHNLIPDQVFSSNLKRTRRTAEVALEAMDLDRPIEIDAAFNEIDYGPDENKTEDEVIARIGQNAIDQWNKDAVVPNGWKVDLDAIIQDWYRFAAKAHAEHPNGTVMLVTSNGIARLAPHLTGDFDGFAAQNKIKISTGALCIFDSNEDGTWSITERNIRPHKLEQKT